MVLVHDTLSYCALQVYEVSALTVFNLQSGHEIAIAYITRGVIEKYIFKKYGSCA